MVFAVYSIAPRLAFSSGHVVCALTTSATMHMASSALEAIVPAYDPSMWPCLATQTPGHLGPQIKVPYKILPLMKCGWFLVLLYAAPLKIDQPIDRTTWAEIPGMKILLIYFRNWLWMAHSNLWLHNSIIFDHLLSCDSKVQNPDIQVFD